jgi:hypothetical protein
MPIGHGRVSCVDEPPCKPYPEAMADYVGGDNSTRLDGLEGSIRRSIQAPRELINGRSIGIVARGLALGAVGRWELKWVPLRKLQGPLGDDWGGLREAEKFPLLIGLPAVKNGALLKRLILNAMGNLYSSLVSPPAHSVPI